MKWAGYFKEWNGPSPEERPVAYIIQCIDTNLSTNCLCDDGLHLEAITLGASLLGIHSCIIKSFNPTEISTVLNIPQRYTPLYVLALGYPAETVELTDTYGSDNADIKYYRTPESVHIVPKRPLKELIIR